MPKRIYIAGPMRGYELYNFPEFDAAKDRLEYDGWLVVSPADIDRQRGFDPTILPADHDWTGYTKDFDVRQCIREDAAAVLSCDAIYLLDGWEDSQGAKVEHQLAKWAGLETYYETPLEAYSPRVSPDHDDSERYTIPAESAEYRKQRPIWSGVLNYFPDAIADVAYCSKVGNDQHNPGQPLHWAREKSTDQHDALARHLIEAGTLDTDGVRHSAKVAWRALAMLQLEIEAERDRAA